AGVVTKGAVSSEDGRERGVSSMRTGEQTGSGMMPSKMVERALERWEGPDYEVIAPRSLRENPAALVDALIERFFQSDLGEKQRAAFIDYARAKKGVIFTNQEVAELCHLMMSTPQYQLA
ncbi:MAG: hypothetical protein ACQKBU_10450, partial [Verrucomicrobiales bacterium]